MKKPLLSVIYVNYNTQSLLEDSLRSLVQNLQISNYEVIVVDNASKDFDQKSLINIYSLLKCKVLNNNIGFGGGNNVGAAEAKGKYLWFLNTDTLVPEDNNIPMLLEFLDTNKEYAAATPLLKNADMAVQKAQVANFPSIPRMILEKPFGLIARLIPITKKWQASYNPGYTPDKDCDVEQAVAAALVVRSDVFDGIKGFSKEYFMYYEDTDLCRKIASLGMKIRFFTNAKIIHLLGQSIKSNYKRKQYYYHSQDIYFAKWQSYIQTFMMRLLRLPLKLYYWVRSR